MTKSFRNYSVVYHAKHVLPSRVDHQKIGEGLAYGSLRSYISEGVGGNKRRQTLQPRCYGPPAHNDVKVTILVDMVSMGESMLNPTDPSKEEKEIQRFFLEVVEMIFTVLFTGGSIENFPGIGQYGSVYGYMRDDVPWFNKLREVLDSADKGEQPGHGRHNVTEDARLKSHYNWIGRNQVAYRNCTLYKERRDEFDRIGFMDLELGNVPYRVSFDNVYNIFKRYERANNYCYPPLSNQSCTNSLEKKLCRWVKDQRHELKDFRNGGGDEYQQYKVQKLNLIGFVWDWKEEYKHLIYQPPTGIPKPSGPIQKFF